MLKEEFVLSLKLLIASHACALPQNQKIFAIAASKRDWDVTMVLPQQWRNEYGDLMPADLYPEFDAELVTAPVFKNGSVPLHGYWIIASKLLRKIEPDVIYSHNEPYAVSTIQWCRAAAKTGNIPFGYFSCQNLVKRYPLPFRTAEAWVYRQSSFAFPITTAVDQVHRTKGYQNASTILPLGFDAAQYFTTQDVRSRHAEADGVTTFAFVGRVVEEKGLVTLAAALGKIRELPWRLIMIGSGPYEPEVKAALSKHGVADRVQWRGFVPHAEVATFYESVDCLLLPSESRPNWTEQFGRVLVESLACGTPLIGSDSGEIPNIIRTTGGGLVFREADADDLAVQLRRMIQDPDRRAEMAATGHRYVHEHYALDRLADRFADAIEAAACVRSS
ncbi:glycosyl transferase group 1 [Rhodopirellula maiorica SM1]|uniref:Glycosyl transferase group 1 n=1 Tax=Rhodopirellula maiorica SM1 TaxID=1265738 RepID=M5RKH9_9BACT|nr:glycosyltransferase family 4 protein [Rhodopirellula maiorica]EMI19805.1 glycosyl transferase group 1 [Rhodopirellula maiorica SM1]